MLMARDAHTIAIDSIARAIENAALEYGKALGTWYPQHGANAPAERNLSLYVALALSAALEGFRFYAEPSLGAHSDMRVDLVAYHPGPRSSGSLIVVEAKRILEKSLGGLCDDLDRIGSFRPANSNSKLRFRQKFGVLLTQTIHAKSAEWWVSGSPVKRDSWETLQRKLENLCGADHLGCRGSRVVHSWRDRGKRFDRFVLWAVWLDRA